MTTRTEALSRLKRARDAFWFSLGGYALLTQEPARSIVSDYEIDVRNDGIDVRSKRAPHEGRRGTRYTIAFSAALDPSAVKDVIERTMRFMLVESFGVTLKYAEENRFTDDLRSRDWYHFARHLRNAYAHGGRWNLLNKKNLPATWRRLTIDPSLHDQVVADGFIGWFDALQLGASMTLFVDGKG